jgi:hypothetical protein
MMKVLTPRRRRRRFFAAGVVVAAVGVMAMAFVSLATPLVAQAQTRTLTRRPTAPACSPRQIRERFVVGHAGSLANGVTGRVYYENLGSTCSLHDTWVGIEAVTGARRTVIGASVTPTVYLLGSIVVKRGDEAVAQISIGSTTSREFRRTVKQHGGACRPKGANAIIILPLYAGWPRMNVALHGSVPVCTQDYFNVSASTIANVTTAS